MKKKKKSIAKYAQNKTEKENLKLANTVINQFYNTRQGRESKIQQSPQTLLAVFQIR